MMEKIWFPTWRYKGGESPRIFATQEELDAAGDGWVDNPDKIGMIPVKEDEPNPVEEVVEEKEETIDDIIKEVDYSKNNIIELRKVATDLGIKNPVRFKKDDLIVLIKEATK